MSEPSSTPWYKQFWPWFLISVPLISMVLSITMFRLASNTTDSLVIDDYYKEGKGINLELTKVQEAKVRNIETKLSINKNRVELVFESGLPTDGTALTMQFQHATLKDRDFSVLLTRNANQHYSAAIENPIDGKWKVTLMSLDQQWKFHQTIALPRQDVITFKPQ